MRLTDWVRCVLDIFAAGREFGPDQLTSTVRMDEIGCSREFSRRRKLLSLGKLHVSDGGESQTSGGAADRGRRPDGLVKPNLGSGTRNRGPDGLIRHANGNIRQRRRPVQSPLRFSRRRRRDLRPVFRPDIDRANRRGRQCQVLTRRISDGEHRRHRHGLLAAGAADVVSERVDRQFGIPIHGLRIRRSRPYTVTGRRRRPFCDQLQCGRRARTR